MSSDFYVMMVVNGRFLRGNGRFLWVEVTADYFIDLGPEGGDGGGEIIAQGTPEAVAQVAASYTGQFLREMLALGKTAVTE